MNERLLANPQKRDIQSCPKCKKHNMSNPDMDSDADYLSYRIPLEPAHKYHTANINPLCKPCVNKIHKEIDSIMRAKVPAHTATCNHFTHATNAEPSHTEFEILVDGAIAYTGYDPRAIKQAMAVKAVKPDKFATPWIRIADIKNTGYNTISINDMPFKITHRDIRKPLMGKIISGYKAQSVNYVAALNGDKTYTIAIGV
jgi:hypothetical protein